MHHSKGLIIFNVLCFARGSLFFIMRRNILANGSQMDVRCRLSNTVCEPAYRDTQTVTPCPSGNDTPLRVVCFLHGIFLRGASAHFSCITVALSPLFLSPNAT